MKEAERFHKKWTSAAGKDDNGKERKIAITSEDMKSLLRFQSQAIKEGFDTTSSYILVLSALVNAYAGMGLMGKAGEVVGEVRGRMEVWRMGA